MRYAFVNEANQFTGNTTRFVDGTPLIRPAGLAVVHFELSQGGVYLMYCNSNWKVFANHWFYSVQGAIERAEYEISGLEWHHI